MKYTFKQVDAIKLSLMVLVKSAADSFLITFKNQEVK
jgi:hypothetical protein